MYVGGEISDDYDYDVCWGLSEGSCASGSGESGSERCGWVLGLVRGGLRLGLPYLSMK